MGGSTLKLCWLKTVSKQPLLWNKPTISRPVARLRELGYTALKPHDYHFLLQFSTMKMPQPPSSFRWKIILGNHESALHKAVAYYFGQHLKRTKGLISKVPYWLFTYTMTCFLCRLVTQIKVWVGSLCNRTLPFKNIPNTESKKCKCRHIKTTFSSSGLLRLHYGHSNCLMSQTPRNPTTTPGISLPGDSSQEQMGRHSI